MCSEQCFIQKSTYKITLFHMKKNHVSICSLMLYISYCEHNMYDVCILSDSCVISVYINRHQHWLQLVSAFASCSELCFLSINSSSLLCLYIYEHSQVRFIRKIMFPCQGHILSIADSFVMYILVILNFNCEVVI